MTILIKMLIPCCGKKHHMCFICACQSSATAILYCSCICLHYVSSSGYFLLPAIKPPKRSTPAPFFCAPAYAKVIFQKDTRSCHAPPSLLRVEMCTRQEYCSTFDSVSCLCRSCRASVCPFSLSCRVASCSFISLCDTRKQQTTGLSLITYRPAEEEHFEVCTASLIGSAFN